MNMATTAVLFIKALKIPVGAIIRTWAPRWDFGCPNKMRAIHCTAPVSFNPAATTYKVAMVITPGLAKPASACTGPSTPVNNNNASADISTRSAAMRVSASVPSTPASVIKVRTACQSMQPSPNWAQTPDPFAGAKRTGGLTPLFNEFAVPEVFDQRLHTLLHRHGRCVQPHFRAFRSLVGGGNAGEVLDLPCPRFLIQAFRVPVFASVQRGVHEHLDELAGGEQVAYQAAVAGEGADEGAENDQAGIGEQLAHLANAADIFYPVVVGEAQILAQAMAHVVAVQQEGVITPIMQGNVHGVGDGGFATAAQAGEPEQAGLLVFVTGAVRAGNFVVMPNNIAHTALQPHSG